MHIMQVNLWLSHMMKYDQCVDIKNLWLNKRGGGGGDLSRPMYSA